MYVAICGYVGDEVVTEVIATANVEEEIEAKVEAYISKNYSEDADVDGEMNSLTINDPDLDYPEFIHVHEVMFKIK